MYFNNIDNCKYFASRFNNQPPVPNRTAGEDEPKTRSYTAVCEPARIGKNQPRYNQVQNFDGVRILTIIWYKYPLGYLL